MIGVFIPIDERPHRKPQGWVIQENGCWDWVGAVDGWGYGRGNSRGQKTGFAHRISYEQRVGPIPEGLQIDHLCRNPLCGNPAHLEAVTGAVNTLRSFSTSALNARKTHCKRGHPFDEANTIARKHDRTHNGGYSRQCRACKNAWARTAWPDIKRRIKQRDSLGGDPK